MKKLKFILIVLVVLINTSFTFINTISKKEILVEGQIIRPKWYQLNGHLQFYLNQKDGKIESLVLRGSCVISIKKVVEIKDIRKDTLTPISLHEDIDKIFLMNVDPLFNENGGFIYISVTDSSMNIDNYHVEVFKEKGIYKTSRIKIQEIEYSEKKYFNEINIKLDKNSNIKEYEILPK